MDEESRERFTIQLTRAQLQYETARLAGKLNVEAAERAAAAGMQPAPRNPDAVVQELPLYSKQKGPRWLISLTTGEEHSKVLRVKLLGEITIGIARPPHAIPDLDLSDQHGEERGVSRMHAALRPGVEHLYLIAFKSTNGTRINGQLAPDGVMVRLDNGDVISFGGLHLALGIEATAADLAE